MTPWTTVPLSRLAFNRTELTSSKHPDDLYVALEDVQGWTGHLLRRNYEAAFSGQVKRFYAGDVLFGKLRPYLAKALRAQQRGVAVGEFLVLRPQNGVDSAFLDWTMRSQSVIEAINTRTAGARMPRAEWSVIRALPVYLPPLEEQRAIARFLDRKSRRIARFIRARQRMIALLTEQKQAIIHQAVTRGLDPDVPLKPSGIDWLGDIPAHWHLTRLKQLYREVDERSDTGAEELLSVSHLTGVTPRSQKNVTMFMAQSNVGHKSCRLDDLVVNTMWAWMGALGVTQHTGLVSPSYGVYRPIPPERLRPQYADLLVRQRLYIDEYNRRSSGITSSRARLYPDDLLSMYMAVPSTEEQDLILSTLAELTANATTNINRCSREIDLVREYRTRLIADVVTGQLDVRDHPDAAEHHPDDLDDPVGFDVTDGNPDGDPDKDIGIESDPDGPTPSDID